MLKKHFPIEYDPDELLSTFMDMPVEADATPTTTRLVSHRNGWIKVEHRGGMIPRLLQLQGHVNAHGDMPIYRHPTDHYHHPIPFTAEVQQVATSLQDALREATAGYP